MSLWPPGCAPGGTVKWIGVRGLPAGVVHPVPGTAPLGHVSVMGAPAAKFVPVRMAVAPACAEEGEAEMMGPWASMEFTGRRVRG